MKPIIFALAVISIQTTISGAAYARERRISGYSCVREGDDRAAYYAWGTAGIANMTGTDPGRTISCPYVDDDRMPKTAVTALNIHGSVYANTATAKACSVQYWNAPNGSFAPTFCGTAKTQSSTSDAVWSFNASELAGGWGSSHGGDFGYVTVDFGTTPYPLLSHVRGVWSFAP